MGQAPSEKGAEECQGQKQTHACGYGEDQYHVRYGRRLSCQDLKVRFGNGYNCAHDNTCQYDDWKSFRLGQLCPYLFPDGHHGHIYPQCEKSHTYNKESGPCQKQHQRVQGNGGNGDSKYQYDTGNGQHR